ncbi:acetyl-CoA C-acetyltransferase [Dongshaea marina]|uniref:acetyl-CoA C-acetyltransferase n=1 Tax=Dongshaea marina TaxID=2047966 RepID=UPI000D3ECEAB|nr:acetyl-CoA C-acetyltransferase [Dongshaea marina]
MEKVYILGAKRTPMGNFNGALSSPSAAELAAVAIKEALSQSGLNPQSIDEVIAGHVLSAGSGMGPARQAAMAAGIPEQTPSYSLNMVCGSGLKAVMDGAGHIQCGQAERVITAGMESMSQAPFILSPAIRSGVRLGHQNALDSLLKDGLTDVFNQYHMGVTAENIARELQISRAEQDRFALLSQQKAAIAIEAGHFSQELASVSYTARRKLHTITTDEAPRTQTTFQALQSLRPAFEEDGSITAGNASVISDGASAIVLASETATRQQGLTPLAEVVGYAQAGVSPKLMGLGPVPAIHKALEKSGLKLDEIDCFELNEAFAAQSLGVIRQLSEQHGVEEKWLLERTNLSGGAIALGHPLGSSGNRILTTLVYQLHRNQLDYGLASLCIGGGMGVALIIKRCPPEVQ